MSGDNGASLRDRASQHSPSRAVSALRVTIPSATWTAMQFYLEAARSARKWTRFEFFLCPELYLALSVNGERPSELFGADVREIDTWAWGWVLMVGSSIQAPFPYEPAQGIEARRAATLGAVHESPVGNADAPNSNHQAQAKG